MPPLKNEFSWSFSRAMEFETCRRKYYYSRYRSWEGWPRGSGDALAKELYFLKKLVHKETVIGTLVHEIIKSAILSIKAGKPWDPETAKSIFKSRFLAMVSSSKQGISAVRFFEHEYSVPLGEDVIQESILHGLSCIDSFAKSKAFAMINSAASDSFLSIDEDTLDPFMLDSTKIYAKPDLVFKHENKVYIYDWKTTRKVEKDYALQRLCYLIYVVQKWNVAPESIVLCELRLGAVQETECVCTIEIFQTAKTLLSDNIRLLKSVLVDSFTNAVTEENAPMTAERTTCELCVFKRICFPQQAKKKAVTLADYF